MTEFLDALLNRPFYLGCSPQLQYRNPATAYSVCLMALVFIIERGI
ncbi:hypothetical protein TRICHSKD4_1055 [Roseibium sp. TrichSKD4]|nr:hypothetical protein [Roseibium sp. TrichSKD4]EFO33936.1 hypothetical protein TRICHSKD4_1055 [Roseibium sp. TrichSKD4]